MSPKKIPAAELNEMVRAAAQSVAACEGCVIGEVVETHPDQTGCNWRISRIEGSHCGECLVALRPLLKQLQAAFLLSD